MKSNEELYKENMDKIKKIKEIMNNELKEGEAKICMNFVLKDGEVFCNATWETSKGEKLLITTQKQSNLGMAVEIVGDMVCDFERLFR